MYTNRHLKLLSSLSTLTQLTGGTPFLWCTVSTQFYTTPQSKRKYYYSLTCVTLLVLFYFFHLVIKLAISPVPRSGLTAPSSLSSSAALWSDELLLFILLTGYVSYIIICLPFYSTPDEYCAWLNGQTKFFIKFIGKFSSKKSWWMAIATGKQKLLERFSSSIILSCCASSVHITLLSFMYPTFSIYPYSLLGYLNPEKYSISLWGKALLYLLNGIFCSYAQSSLLVGATNLMYQVLSLLFLCYTNAKEFRMGRSSYTTSDNLRANFEIFSLQYRALEVTVMLFCYYFGTALIPFLFILIPGLVCANYTMIRHWTEMEALVRIVFISYLLVTGAAWLIFLTISGHFHRESIRILESWKNDGDICSRIKGKMLMSRFRKCCRKLYIKNLSLNFKVKADTSGRFIVAVSRGTFRSALTIGVM